MELSLCHWAPMGDEAVRAMLSSARADVAARMPGLYVWEMITTYGTG